MNRLVIYGIIALAVVALITATVVGIYHKGYAAGEAAIKLEWEAANRTQREKEATQANAASTTLEVVRAKDKVVFRTITERVNVEVEKPIYRDVCLAPVGLCLANAAIRGESPDTCKPDPAVPGIKPPGGRVGVKRLTLDYRLGGSVSGLRGEAPEPG